MMGGGLRVMRRRLENLGLLRKVERMAGDRVRGPVGQALIIGCHSDGDSDVVDIRLLSSVVVVVRDHIVVDVVIGEISFLSLSILDTDLMVVSMLQAPGVVIHGL